MKIRKWYASGMWKSGNAHRILTRKISLSPQIELHGKRKIIFKMNTEETTLREDLVVALSAVYKTLFL
jgi:hypothetical protein